MTDQQYKNGISIFDIDSVDSESFLDYLSSQSSSGNSDDTNMMSAKEFYNNF